MNKRHANHGRRWVRYLRGRLVHIAGCKECQECENRFFFESATMYGARVPRSLRKQVERVRREDEWR